MDNRAFDIKYRKKLAKLKTILLYDTRLAKKAALAKEHYV